ncbi:matrilin-1-like [Tubulanus polymorphus]|uniref:matrilin-1-like n=1 Tax=Tubulanus polymorphus TaxID=672921 RepID=UPI003DA31F85
MPDVAIHGSITGEAIKKSYQKSMSQAYGGRADAEKFMIVFFDGFPSNQTALTAAANGLNKNGVKRIVLNLQDPRRIVEPNDIQKTNFKLAANPSSDAYSGSAADNGFIEETVKKLISGFDDLCPKPPAPAPEKKKCDLADIVFIVDVSASTRTAEWANAMHVVDYVSSNAFGHFGNETQIGLLSYARATHGNFALKAGNSKAAVTDLVAKSSVEYLGRSTATSNALKYARDVSFSAAHSRRNSTAKMIVLLYDGVSRSAYWVKQESEKNVDAGIESIVVGVPGHSMSERSQTEYQAISNNNNDLKILVSSWQGVATKVSAALQKICAKGSGSAGAGVPGTKK